MEIFKQNNQELLELVNEWENILLELDNTTITERKNSQNRSIKQIVGHMIDSATNNTHRIIHLQYGKNPLDFPDYANLGNNDKWIAIQNYQEEDWYNLVQLWKFSNIHITHIIENVDQSKLKNEWITGLGDKVSLMNMITDYLRHFKLHINELRDLIGADSSV